MNVKYFTTGHIGKMLGVSDTTARRWAKLGKLKSFTLPSSKEIRVCKEDLIEFLKQNNMPIPRQLTEKVILVVGPQKGDFVYTCNIVEAGIILKEKNVVKLVVDCCISIRNVMDLMLAFQKFCYKLDTVILLNEDEDDFKWFKLWFDRSYQKPISDDQFSKITRIENAS